MQLREAILRETLNGLRDRAARYRRVSSLLGGRPKDSRLTALAREIEEWADQIERTMEKVHTQVAATHVLVAEIDACIGRAGQEVAFSKMRRNGRYSADDLREEARLCAEEARARGHGRRPCRCRRERRAGGSDAGSLSPPISLHPTELRRHCQYASHDVERSPCVPRDAASEDAELHPRAAGDERRRRAPEGIDRRPPLIQVNAARP